MYDVILADPPWRFEVYDRKTGLQKSPDQHYPTMPFDRLCSMPVKEFAAENCALFLWVVDWLTPAMLNRLFNAWGFTYRTKAWTWFKTTQDESRLTMGTGYYTRGNPEDCLLAVRGRMPVQDRGILKTQIAPEIPDRAAIINPRMAHSRKPDFQYEIIERLYPQAHCLELFARRKRAGWSAWGNEVESDIQLEVV